MAGAVPGMVVWDEVNVLVQPVSRGHRVLRFKKGFPVWAAFAAAVLYKTVHRKIPFGT